MIYIYTMGKVGSQSILYTLKNEGIPCEHMHYIYGGGEYDSYRKQGAEELRTEIYPEDRIISLVREPLARNLSAYFHNNEKRNLSAAEMHADFLENYYFHYPDVWFETELNRLFDIDIFARDFPTEQGYKIYNENLMIIRLENLNDVFTDCFEEFTGYKNIQLDYFNSAKSKNGSNRYYDMCKMKYPYSVVLQLQMLYTFYSDREIKGFINKWESEVKR